MSGAFYRRHYRYHYSAIASYDGSSDEIAARGILVWVHHLADHRHMQPNGVWFFGGSVSNSFYHLGRTIISFALLFRHRICRVTGCDGEFVSSRWHWHCSIPSRVCSDSGKSITWQPQPLHGHVRIIRLSRTIHWTTLRRQYI